MIDDIQKSESIMNLAKALANFQSEVKSVGKDGANPFFKSSYATLDNILQTVIPVLTKNQLAVSQFPVGVHSLCTVLLHSSGEWIKGTYSMVPKDASPQALGSVITYQKRYALSAILGISTDVDDDGNSASSPASKPVTVKTGKIGSEEDFAKAMTSIEKMKTVAECEQAIGRLEKSTKFTDGQKDTLEKAISSKIDQFLSQE